MNPVQNLYTYHDYVDFLQDFYAFKKDSDPQFTYISLAERSGFKSRSHIRNIFKGEKKPAKRELEVLCNSLDLEPRVIKYLLLIYELNHAKSPERGVVVFQALMRVFNEEKIKKNPFKELYTFSSLLHLTLLTLIGLKDFRDDPAWIIAHLRIKVEAGEVAQTLGDLSELGLISRNPEGNWRLNQSYVKVFNKSYDHFLKLFHRDCLKLSAEALENWPKEDRYLVGSSFRIPARHYPRLITKINQFIDHLIETENFCEDADTVVQLNTQLLRIAGTGELKPERATSPDEVLQ